MLPPLEKTRLSLREIQLKDAPALQAYQTSQSFWSCGQAMEPEEFANGQFRIQLYNKYKQSKSGQTIHVYVAYDKSKTILIGEAGLSLDNQAGATLGFSVAPVFWGQGYATEIASRMIAYGFQDLNLNSISAEVAIENKASQRVLEKIGMIYQSTKEDSIWAQGRWWTEAIYTIQKQDYDT